MELTENTHLDEILASDRLPSPTGVALKILELTRDEMASAEQLEQTLLADPALAGQVLKFANSADTGGRLVVKTVSEAIVRLGMTAVRQLALGFSVVSNARGGHCAGFDYETFWAQSLATAVCAQTLAQTVPGVPAEEAFTCGLLNRIGSLCLASVHADGYTDILETWNQGAPDELLVLEQEYFSIDHYQVSLALFADWGLPEYYHYAVLNQNRPDWMEQSPGTGCQLARLLCVANQFAEVCITSGRERNESLDQLRRLGSQLCGNEEAILARCNEALDEWVRLGSILDIVTGKIPSFDKLAVQADQPGNVMQEKTATADVNDRGPDSLRILVVDDDPTCLRLIEKILSKAGHEVTTAKDGADALNLSLQQAPQLVVTDWMMPRMNGIELCGALRRSEELARTYVIVVTGDESGGNLVEAFESGVDDYLEKPVDKRALLARLRAGQRVIALQERVEQDREKIRKAMAKIGVANRQLKHLALYDQLTTLPNRRYAIDRIEQEWDRSVRGGTPFLCMLLDIDHFKKVNDTWGHDAGDVVLQSTALVMKKCMRSSDVVCRFGGEEFLAICPSADLEVAKELGNRLRRSIETNIIDTPEFQGNVTVSIGVAGRSQEVESPKDVIKLADEALYAAKEAGRNKVCIVGIS